MLDEANHRTLKLIVLSGLPGAGKSTAARRLHRCYDARVVARDDLRKLLDDVSEYELTIHLVELAGSFLRDGTSVIVDACNLSPRDFERWLELSLATGATIEWVHLDTPTNECVRRDASRADPVGPAAIRAMARATSACLAANRSRSVDG